MLFRSVAQLRFTSPSLPRCPRPCPNCIVFFVPRMSHLVGGFAEQVLDGRDAAVVIKGLCHAAVISRDEKNILLMGMDKGHMEDVARILELPFSGEQAADRWEVAHSDFLTPPVLDDALAAIRKLSDMGAVVSGGYAQAERCRLSVGQVEAIDAGRNEGGETGYPGAVAALRTHMDTHGDFLGAILGTGIASEKVGDIIVQGEKGPRSWLFLSLLSFHNHH